MPAPKSSITYDYNPEGINQYTGAGAKSATRAHEAAKAAYQHANVHANTSTPSPIKFANQQRARTAFRATRYAGKSGNPEDHAQAAKFQERLSKIAPTKEQRTAHREAAEYHAKALATIWK